MAINVVISQDDLTVLAPPSNVDLQVEVGPTGPRGSKIYSGANEPTIDTTPFINDPPKLGDLFITRNSLFVYEYVVVPGGNIWRKILDINASLEGQQAITLDISSSVYSASSIYSYRAPFDMTLSKTPRSYLSVASTSGSVVVDINKNGSSIFGSNKLSINENDLTSVSASVSASVVVTSISDNDLLTVDVDDAGTNAQNLKIILFYTR